MNDGKLCPYVCNITQVNQNSYTYDENGNNTFLQHILNETKTFVPCQGERCGVWRDGRCGYCSD